MSKITGITAVSLVAIAVAVPASAQCADQIGRWEWTLVNPDASWARRAGLQVVELNGIFYLMGGRTTREPSFPPIPGDSDIWGDVWTSNDRGASWEKILDTDTPGHWPARAYFRAVKKGEYMYVLGGQDFAVVENPDCLPPYDDCLPFLSVSNFFNDVWRSSDGINWTQMTADAGWSVRAGLGAVVFNDEIYVIGGSFLDDPAIFGGPPIRVYYNDVWKSSDGATWVQVAENPPFPPRAGGVAVEKDGFIYLLGGEEGFLCEPLPFCDPPYFNDVWRSQDGASWELVVESADWSPRPGHQAVVVEDQIVLFGGFGLSDDPNDIFAPGNPMDVWVSEDGAVWEQVSDSPWNAAGPEQIKYDFAALATEGGEGAESAPAIFTFGGDRETFDFSDPLNWLNLDNDVWRFTVDSCPADLNNDGYVGFFDVVGLILSWGGPCDGCPADLNCNGHVGLFDLLIMLSQWGACS